MSSARWKNISCFGCGGSGHVRSQCPSVSRANQGRTLNSEQKRSCFRCGKVGHLAKQCRMTRNGEQLGNYRGSPSTGRAGLPGNNPSHQVYPVECRESLTVGQQKDESLPWKMTTDRL
uniref:CCHC-type domain-containing protein n=1 Tax=Buteo japonicus TaxID=224669 RepID=A0A8B9YYQ1_9AVES